MCHLHVLKSPMRTVAAPGGFTLVELLVVIAIIALLISILLPAMRDAREQGKSAVCMSNMRQIGLAMQTYALENREYIPASSCPSAAAPEDNYWLCVLQRYSRQYLIAHCLNDRSTKPFLDWAHPPENLVVEGQNYRWSSYAINFCLVPTPQNPHEYNRLNRLPRPEFVIYLAEVRSGDGFDHADHIHADLWEGLEDPKGEVAWDRHLGKSSYLYGDSHVDKLRWKQTWEFPVRNLWWPSHAPGWNPELLPP